MKWFKKGIAIGFGLGFVAAMGVYGLIDAVGYLMPDRTKGPPPPMAKRVLRCEIEKWRNIGITCRKW